MIVLKIHCSSETYTVDETGNIGRPAIGMSPSGGWKFVGIRRYTNFGHSAEFIPFERLRDPAVLASIQWRYKNGTSRWHGCDIDHGTSREWMSPNDLQRVEIV